MITTSSYAYSGYKMLSGLRTIDNKKNQAISQLCNFFSTFLWRNFTFLSLDTQKDWNTYVESMNNAIQKDWGFISAHTDLLLYDDAGMLLESDMGDHHDFVSLAGINPSQESTLDRISISILIFNCYLYSIDVATEKALRCLSNSLSDTQPEGSPGLETQPTLPAPESKSAQESNLKRISATTTAIRELETAIAKTTRFVKYSLSLFETVACKKLKRKEVVYRCHFDFLYLAYLSFLFAMVDKCADTELEGIFKKVSTSMSTFLLVLIELTDSKEKNFSMMVKMRRQKFSVQCNSLAYRTAMDLMQINGKPIWELESFDVHKVAYVLSRTRSCRATITATLFREPKNVFSA